MGGQLCDFNRSSMFDFDVRLEAYKQTHGITDDPDDDITSAADLDRLYAAVGDNIQANPEAWQQ